MFYSTLADLILILHTAFIAFVVIGLLLILLGGALTWRWVRHRLFRIVHLIAIGIVVVQSWLGLVCPLTIWEMSLREKAGQVTYSESFIAHWLHEIIYFQAPEWVFTLSYTLFAGLVLLSWIWIPPIKHANETH